MSVAATDVLLVLEGPPGFGPTVEGEALVTGDAFSPRYDLDRTTGEISRRGHRAEGQNIKDKVLVVTTSKGGVAAGWAFYDLRCRGLAPKALICRSTNTVFVQGCVLAGIPILHRLTPDPMTALGTGDRVRVEPWQGRILVLERSSSR